MNTLIKTLRKLRIRLHHRYTLFKTNYLGFPVWVVDKSSFLYMCEEIIDRQIYQFQTDNPKPFIIDAGANIGLATLYFKLLFPQARIIAFEPDPKACAALRNNLTINETTNVEVIEKGLAKNAGTVKFYAEGADGGHIVNDVDKDQLITIETVRLSDYLQDQLVDFLKIDIEGAELEVLEESAPYLKQVKRLFVEYHGLATNTKSLDRLLALLSEAGFSYYLETVGIASKQPFIKINTYAGFSNQINIFAYRQNKL